MSKEELKHNKAVRGAYKGHCNQDIKRAERLMADTEAINITELKAIGERLSRWFDEIKVMDTAILKALETDEEISKETDQTLTTNDYQWRGLPMTSQNYEKPLKYWNNVSEETKFYSTRIWNRFQKSARPQLMCNNYKNFMIAARATFVP